MVSVANASRIKRDRAGTEDGIVEAAKLVLAEEGFSAFGINAIARRAGCDKQLIYRYFGGLDGLVDAIGNDLADLFQELMEEPGDSASVTYAAFVEHLVLALLTAFRRSDLLLRIAAWEVLDPSPVTRRLADVRGRALGAWIQARRGSLAVPGGVDSGAINAVLIAAVQHLALSARAVGGFSGVALDSDADWQRIEDTLRTLVRNSYPEQRS
ncbi:MAG: TetR/AcrR family transcriptional regulator [Sphingomonas sp.]|nr:TetR/AcrR family transcriptional regulator [Sphingomonas sp.]